MTIQVPEELQGALQAQADAVGLSVEAYVGSVLANVAREATEPKPSKSMLGMWAKYDIHLSAEEIDENRKDMFKNFGEDF